MATWQDMARELKRIGELDKVMDEIAKMLNQRTDWQQSSPDLKRLLEDYNRLNSNQTIN